MNPMARVCCLAGIGDGEVAKLRLALHDAGELGPTSVVRLNVAELGKLAPQVLLCDIDDSDVDALELVRRLRFVLPECIIAVYTLVMEQTWALECHLAGANCVLSKNSTEAELARGLRSACSSGCFTDPRFVRA
jgi:DNA-binding NarL/FixJ family response regulator